MIIPMLCVTIFVILVVRSEERFSRNAETDLVCRLLLEKKKKQYVTVSTIMRSASTPSIYLFCATLACQYSCSQLYLFFNDTSPIDISTLSLHDALPISTGSC